MSGAGAVLAAGYWDTQSGTATTAPGSGKYQADNWAAPALLALDGHDQDGYDRHAGLVSLQPGDSLLQLSRTDSQDWLQLTVGTVTDLTTWVQLAVTVAGQGGTFAAPGSNTSMLLQALRETVPPGTAWAAWAPPLDPPTAGGLPVATAQAIADATWAIDPHLTAALQWEAYAASLPPAASVAQVSTGAQSVSYSPPMPGGEFGLAMARAAWHRSLMGSGGTVPLDVAPPALPSVPGNPWNAGTLDWWDVA